MKKLLFVVAVIGLIFAAQHLYNQGLKDGEQQYKRSHRMYLALKSAYMFGWT